MSYDDTKNNSRYGIALADLRKYVGKYKDAFKKEFEVSAETESILIIHKITVIDPINIVSTLMHTSL